MINFKDILVLIKEILIMYTVIPCIILHEIYRMWFPPSPKDVKDEIVLITGTGHGIGREMALRFGRLGATVVCVDINPTSNEETGQIIKAEKGRAYTYQCDVTNRTAVMELAEKVKRDLGDVYILVNNAGIMPCKSVLQQTEKEIRLMNDINVNANLWMIQAFLPAMISRNHGHIVAMSSMAGLIGLANLVPYCASKFAVKGMMEALAVELHQDPRNLSGIKFTTIYPYMVDTGLCQKPRIKFPNAMNLVKPGDAAEMIIDAVRRDVLEITIPTYLYYGIRYVQRLIPFRAALVHLDFFNSGVDAHD